MKILVCGDRNWHSFQKIHDALSEYPARTILVHGACRGADLMAASAGRVLGFDVRSYPANWNEYGTSAGPVRNMQMISEEAPFDLVLAFHSNIQDSKGTADMVSRCRKAGWPVKIIV